MMEDKILAESTKYKIHSISENVYLIDKTKNTKLGDNLDCFYDKPNDALISENEEYVVIVGDHVAIYFFESKQIIEVNILYSNNWINGLFQDISEDNSWDYFRFVAYDEDNKLCIFKMNVYDLKPIKIGS